MIFLVAFLLMFSLDFVWVRYMRSATHGSPLAAANYSAVLFGLGALNTLAYVADPLLLIPGAAGAWAGTFVATGGLSDSPDVQ